MAAEQGNMNSSSFYERSIALVFVMLWVYAGVSKLQEYEVFRSQLLQQPFPGWAPEILVWGLPILELSTAVLLLYRKTRAWGLSLSFALMLLFTGYVALVLGGTWDHVPCACGGILNSMGWADHFLFNLFFTALAGTGILVERKKRGAGPGRDGASGDATYHSGGR